MKILETMDGFFINTKKIYFFGKQASYIIINDENGLFKFLDLDFLKDKYKFSEKDLEAIHRYAIMEFIRFENGNCPFISCREIQESAIEMFNQFKKGIENE